MGGRGVKPQQNTTRVGKDPAYQISSKSKILKFSHSLFEGGGGISSRGSNPQNIKPDYPKISHINFDQKYNNEFSQTKKRMKFPPHLGGNFPRWSYPQRHK